MTFAALVPGVTYTVTCHFNGSGVPADIVRTFTHTKAAWQGNQLGKDQIFDPSLHGPCQDDRLGADGDQRGQDAHPEYRRVVEAGRRVARWRNRHQYPRRRAGVTLEAVVNGAHCTAGSTAAPRIQLIEQRADGDRLGELELDPLLPDRPRSTSTTTG